MPTKLAHPLLMMGGSAGLPLGALEAWYSCVIYMAFDSILILASSERSLRIGGLLLLAG